MTVYVALLGGINVGGRTLKSDALARSPRVAGSTDVSTFIQSGNVLFRSGAGAAAVGNRLHDAILEDAGIDTRVAMRTAAQLRAVVAANPFLDRTDDPTKVSVTFLFDGVTPDAVGRGSGGVRPRRGRGDRARGVPAHAERDGQDEAGPAGGEEARAGGHDPQLAVDHQARRPRGGDDLTRHGPDRWVPARPVAERLLRQGSRRAPTDTPRAGGLRHCTMKAVTIPNIIPSSFSAWLRMWQWYAHTPFSASVGLTSTV